MMNPIPTTIAALILASLTGSGTAFAQSAGGELPPELLACAEETDVERRLACFDREMARHREMPAPEPVPEPMPEPTPEAPPAEPVAVEPAPEPEAAPVADFGLPEEGPTAFSATVTDIATRPRGELIILLDNGQIWEQKHQDSRFRLAVGEQVTISKGLISGYRLSGGNRNNSIQVERLK
jgi:hypothetical protein